MNSWQSSLTFFALTLSRSRNGECENEDAGAAMPVAVRPVGARVGVGLQLRLECVHLPSTVHKST